MATQVDAQRPNPKSAELTVQLVKRYLARPEHRIRLHDVLAEESRAVANSIRDPTAFAISSGASPEDYRARVRRYESAVATAMRIFGIIGRWGDEQAHAVMKSLLTSPFFGPRADWSCGLNFGFSTPLCFLFYAIGLGVLKAGIYGGLYRWLTQSVYRDHQDDLPFIQRYGYWLSEMAQHWKMLDGLERHKTPLSDHLHDVTQPLSLDIALAERDHTRLFELFETLTALAYLTVKASEEDLTHTLASEGGRETSFGHPSAVLGGTTSRAIRFLLTMRTPEMRRSLLDAGFAHGDQKYFSQALQSIQRLMGRIQSSSWA